MNCRVDRSVAGLKEFSEGVIDGHGKESGRKDYDVGASSDCCFLLRDEVHDDRVVKSL